MTYCSCIVCLVQAGWRLNLGKELKLGATAEMCMTCQACQSVFVAIISIIRREEY